MLWLPRVFLYNEAYPKPLHNSVWLLCRAMYPDGPALDFTKSILFERKVQVLNTNEAIHVSVLDASTEATASWFRLTRQQTRFLISEFSIQPHPDAAHREWLSREMPGLSSRQVQAWFQNR
ncbi:hypothetical protein HZ326_27373 [Fusarium oxysporum f. sp. albedinis]|nr:Uncharacterized protein HZ326_29160 [Fusarium oxysporum f. sp. albedinis]KAJ0129532.1 hypothetical protein HZ326_27373 [Fusarium oxysporum f. sp. albedinis]